MPSTASSSRSANVPSDSGTSSSSSLEPQEVPDPSRNFGEYFPALQAALGAITQDAQNLPEASDLTFHRSLDRKLGKDLDATAARLVSLANGLAGLVEDKGKGNAKGKQRVTIDDADDLIEDFERHVQETLDRLLEKADTELDLYTGRQKKAAIQIREDALAAKRSMRPLAPDHTPTSSRLSYALLHAKDLAKPQLAFPSGVDNFECAGPSWPSLMPAKQHAMVPIGWEPTAGATDAAALETLLAKARTRQVARTLSPYAYETLHLQYPNSLFDASIPIPPVPFATTPFTFVDTNQQLEGMVEKLKAAKEIAVDLEHNGFRSYNGIVCLMQISTREEDWVVDTLALRQELTVGKLGGVLVDPSIVKVFHGADSDIIWLQQNFGMFVVGLFDTYHATKVLEFPAHGLASLLSLYCDFTADKRYQMADWRIRPLPEEMLYYARTDTHYLLYVYDQLRNALLSRSRGSQDLVREVLARSAVTALKVYEVEEYDFPTGAGVSGWKGLARKYFGMKTSTPGDERALMWGHGRLGLQVEMTFKRVHEWRDKVAREEDESTGYVLPNDRVANIARASPANRSSLLALIGHNHPIAVERADEIIDVIAKAKKEGQDMWDKQQGGHLPEQTQIIEVMDVDDDIETPLDSRLGTPVAEVLAIASPSSATLWSVAKAPLKALSSLFGSTVSSSPGPSTPSAPLSSMFGSTLERKPAAVPQDQAVKGLFDVALSNVLASMSSTSVAAETVVFEPSKQQPSVGLPVHSTSAPSAAAPTEPEQIPYVKPSSRVSKSEQRDDIVVVGRQSRKRKKSKVDGVAGTSVSATATPEPQETETSTSQKKKRLPVKSEDIPEFSYADEPNQLDTFSEETKAKVRKAKKVRKPVVDTSNFRKPPQDPSMPQAGNRSMTFK